MADRLAVISINFESANIIFFHAIQIIAKSYHNGVYLQIETIALIAYKYFSK